MLSNGAHLTRTRNRFRLLLPTLDRDVVAGRLDATAKARTLVEGADRERMEELLRRLSEPRRNRPRHIDGRAVVVETEDDAASLRRNGVDGYCTIYAKDELDMMDDARLIIYGYREGDIDMGGGENVIIVPADSSPASFAPEAVLDWVRVNRGTLEAAAGVMALVGRQSVIPGVLERAAAVPEAEFGPADVEEFAVALRDELDARLKDGAGDIRVEGAQVLELMADGRPPSLDHLFNRVIEEGRGRVRERFGVIADIFLPTYPVSIDREALAELIRSVTSMGAAEGYRNAVSAAKKVEDLMDDVRAELDRALELEYTWSLGKFASRMELCRPVWGERFTLAGATHLDLVGRPGAQSVDYTFGGPGEPDQIVLLTGANSGGKTTLMETVAQACLMTHMGLGVRADSAVVRPVESLVLFERRRNLDAGAFEDFLEGFMPLAAGGARALILADEVEAMTEPEAAAIILSTFIDRLRDGDSSAMLVTHMAPRIVSRTEVTVDGIEARGLDDDYNLLVDRTPRRGLLARSTPELIVRRLEARSDGEMKALYRRVLERFGDREG
jgi:hypothetical protein